MQACPLWVNGQATSSIDADDRGLLYGDGFFTTMYVSKGVPRAWKWHWQRLQRAALALAFPPLDEQQLLNEIAQAAEQTNDIGMRLTLTRGRGGRGYSPPDKTQVSRILQCFALPSHYEVWRAKGLLLGVAQRRLATQMTELTGLKTLNRLEQVLIKTELGERKVDDLVVLEQNGFIAEASAANLFWRQGNQWYTPALTRTGVHGTLRAMLLTLNPQVKQGDYPLEHLLAAEECLLCNAILGCAPVRGIDKLEFTQVGHFQGLQLKE